MADTAERAAKTAAVMSGAAATAAALALLKAKPVGAAPFPPEIVQLLIAIAENTTRLVELLERLGPSGRGWPPQRDYIQAIRILFPIAFIPIQLPDWTVPDGYILQVIAWPNNNGLIWIGESQAAAANINQVVPLARGGSVGYHIKNADTLWAAALVANDAITVTCER